MSRLRTSRRVAEILEGPGWSSPDQAPLAEREGADWAERVAVFVQAEMSREASEMQRLGLPELHLRSVLAVGPDAVEVVFTVPGDDTPRGIRLDASSVDSASDSVRSWSVVDLANYLVILGIVEPRRIEDFTPPDERTRAHATLMG